MDLPRPHGSARAVTLSLVLAAIIAQPAAAQSPPAGAVASPDAPGSPATITWQRLPDDPKFAGNFAPTLTGAAVLPDGSIVAVGPRDPAVFAMESGLESNVSSWVLPPDGTAWNFTGFPSPNASVFGNQNVSLAQGPAGLVAVNDKGVTWTSADGLDWTQAKVPHSAMFDVQGNGAGYAAVDGAFDSPALWTSADGVDWQATKLGKVGRMHGNAYALAHSPDLGYLMGGSARGVPLLWTSPDGESWTAVTPPVGAKKKHTVSVTDIAAGPAGFLLLVADRSNKGVDRSTLWTSPDGQTWQQVAEHDGRLDTVTAVGDGFVAVGPGTVMASPDGATWTTTPEPLFDGFSINTVTVAPDGRIVAAGNAVDAPQAAVWVGTPGTSTGPTGPAASPMVNTSAPPDAPESPVAPAASTLPVALACLDATMYNYLQHAQSLDMVYDKGAGLADALEAYDPVNDQAFKGYAKFISLRDKLVREVRKQVKVSTKAATKGGVYRYDENIPLDAMAMLDKYKVRVCK
jgi:hypothetical protein